MVLPEETLSEEIIFPGAVTGAKSRKHNVITTCGDGPAQWEAFNLNLQQKYQKIRDNEQKWESVQTEDADIILVAFGSVARVALDWIVNTFLDNFFKVVFPILYWCLIS